MQRATIHTDDLPMEQTQPGYSWRGVALGPLIGASGLGASVYVLPPGQATFPYHSSTGARSGCWS